MFYVLQILLDQTLLQVMSAVHCPVQEICYIFKQYGKYSWVTVLSCFETVHS